MKAITELSELKIGDKIHSPKLNKDFVLVEYAYNEIFKQMIANLSPMEQNESGFTISLKDLIKLGYMHN